MELLEYTRTGSSDNNEKTIENFPLAKATEKHISIQRLNYFPGLGNDKHYKILWILRGVKTVMINDEIFNSYPNLLVLISPGQKLKIETTEEPEGWILRFSTTYLNLLRHENFALGNVNLFSDSDKIPKIVLSPKIGERIHSLAGMIDELAGSHIPKKENAIHSLFKAILIYCDSRCNVSLDKNANPQEIRIVSNFKQLVTDNFTRLHMVSDYAKIMNISPKYLNQIVKQIMGVTAKQVIQEQIIIKARRELKFSNSSIKEIAFSLGYSDPFHFSNFFKDSVGSSPTLYRNR